MTASTWARSQAGIRAVPPKRLRMERSGLRGNISRMISARPSAPASSQGVSRFAACALMSAPASISRRATSTWFPATASSSAVWPSMSLSLSGVRPAMNRATAAASPRAAALRNISPLAEAGLIMLEASRRASPSAKAAKRPSLPWRAAIGRSLAVDHAGYPSISGCALGGAAGPRGRVQDGAGKI